MDKTNSELNLELNLVQMALVHLGLALDPNDQILKNLTPNHVIEIFDRRMIQIYRSFNFFNYCNYTIEDISTHEWYLLWQRSPQITASLLEEFLYAMRHQVSNQKMNSPQHIVYESLNSIHSSSQYFEVKYQFISTLLDENKSLSGVLCLSERFYYSEQSAPALIG